MKNNLISISYRYRNYKLYRLVFFVIFGLIFNVNFIGQDSSNIDLPDRDKAEFDYRKKPWKGNNAMLNEFLESIDYFGNENKVRYLVPIKFWLYHNNDGTGGASYSMVDTFMKDLNHYYKINKTGLRFYISEIKDINKSNKKLL